MNNEIKARIINFRKSNLTDDKTGEVTTLFNVTYAVDCDPVKNFYGREILTSVASENALAKLQSCLDKEVKIVVDFKQIYGERNKFKKVITKIDGFDIRKF